MRKIFFLSWTYSITECQNATHKFLMIANLYPVDAAVRFTANCKELLAVLIICSNIYL